MPVLGSITQRGKTPVPARSRKYPMVQYNRQQVTERKKTLRFWHAIMVLHHPCPCRKSNGTESKTRRHGTRVSLRFCNLYRGFQNSLYSTRARSRFIFVRLFYINIIHTLSANLATMKFWRTSKGNSIAVSQTPSKVSPNHTEEPTK